MHIWNWDEWAQKTIPVPMVVGHEYAGEIVEVGSHVEDLKVGQRVSGEGHVIGGRSRAARAGKFHLDPETKGIGVNIPNSARSSIPSATPSTRRSPTRSSARTC